MARDIHFRTERILHLKKNITGNDYVVGDVHGCIRALMNALKLIGFNPSQDRLISVGDLVDRGPDNIMALNLLNQDWFYAVIGNHEEMHINQFFDPLGRDGMNWAMGYIERAMQKIQCEDDTQYFELVHKMKQLPLLIDIETDSGLVGIVHAEVPPHIRSWEHAMDIAFCTEPAQFKDSKLLWGRSRAGKTISLDGRPQDKVAGVSLILCGHNVVSEPTWYGNHLNIDTGAVFGVMGRTDLHADPALTIVNLTKMELLSFPIVYGDTSMPTISALAMAENSLGSYKND